MEVKALTCLYCNSPIALSADSGVFRCKSCGSTFTYEQLGFHKADLKGFILDLDKDDWKDRYKIVSDNEYDTYTCSQCGASVEVSKNDIWKECPFCKQNLATATKVSGRILPDFIIPFSISSEEAKARFKEKCDKLFFINREFLKDIDSGKLSAIYLPLWVYSFDLTCKAYLEEEYEVNDSKRTYEYKCDVETTVKHWPVDADKNFDRYISEFLSNYDLMDAVEYSPKAVVGIKSKQFTDTPIDCFKHILYNLTQTLWGRIKDACNHGLNDEKGFIKHKHGSTDSVSTSDIDFASVKILYGLVPVYTIKYDKTQVFINGQTGLVANNDLPRNKLREWIVNIPGILLFIFLLIVTFSGIIYGDKDSLELGICLVFLVPGIYFMTVFHIISKTFKTTMNSKTRLGFFSNTKLTNFSNKYHDVTLK